MVSKKRILISIPPCVSIHAESNPGPLGSNNKYNNKTEANEFTNYGGYHNYGMCDKRV